MFHPRNTGLIWDAGLEMPLFPPSLRARFSPPAVVAGSIPRPRAGLRDHPGAVSPSLSLALALPLHQDELSPPSPGGDRAGKISGAPPGGNWVIGSDGSDGSRAPGR